VAADDPGTLANAALALASFGEDIGAMMALVDRALALNPSYARGWHISGLLRLWAGQPDLAIEQIQVSPKNRLSRSEQRTLQQTKNNYLTGKAPYGFESCSLRRRVSR
jgi:hypothetical protein